jgi:hypothetical protein
MNRLKRKEESCKGGVKDVGCGKWNVECENWNVGCGMLNVE